MRDMRLKVAIARLFAGLVGVTPRYWKGGQPEVGLAVMHPSGRFTATASERFTLRP
jgi:hypothetical protein